LNRLVQLKWWKSLNTSSKINITIKVEEKGFMIYDDTQSFIEFVAKNDQELVSKIVTAIVEDRLNGKQSSSLW
jgi:hypothetical protein